MTESTQAQPKSRLRRCCGFLWRWSKRLVLFAVVAGIAYVLWANWYGQREAQRMLDELRQRGLATSYRELLATLPSIPPERDGTRLYRAAVEMADLPYDETRDLPYFGSGRAPARGQMPDDALAQRLATFIEQNCAFYDCVSTALEYECDGYDIFTDEAAPQLHLAHLPGSRKVAHLLQLQCLHRSIKGDGGGAVAATTDILRWSHSLDRDPVAIAWRVRISILTLATSELEIVLSRTTSDPHALRACQTQLKDEWVSILNARALEGELAFIASALRYPKARSASETLLAEQLLALESHFDWTLTAALPEPGTGGELPLPAFMMEPTPQRVRMVRDIVRIWSTICPGAAQTVVAGHLQNQLELFDAYAADPDVFLADINQGRKQLPPSGYGRPLPGVLTSLGTAATTSIVTSTAIDIECYRIEHGDWPASLDALPGGAPNDPFADAPLRYKRTDNGVIVYSVGFNHVDDGGEQDGMIVRDGDIAFRLFDPPVRGTLQPPPPAEPMGGGFEGMILPDDARIAD